MQFCQNSGAYEYVYTVKRQKVRKGKFICNTVEFIQKL